MNLSEISIKNPVFAWMLMIGLMVFGVIGCHGMGVGQMPDVDFPVLNVSVLWEGAAPEVMESDVVDIIEDSVMGIEGLREISSSSAEGKASIKLEFDLDRDIDVALQEVQSKISEARRRLPTDVDPPIIQKFNPEDQPIMWLSITSRLPLKELMDYVDRSIKDRFKTVPGVGEIFLGGFLERNLRVWIDTPKLAAYQLTVEDVIAAIQTEHVEIPAGKLETQEKESAVRAMGEAQSVVEFEKIVINSRNGKPIYRPIKLSEVARIEDGLADLRRMSRTGGEPSVGLGIRKQRGANTVAVADGVRKRLAEIQRELPTDFSIGINFDSSKFISDSVHELFLTLILSAVLTSLVCWLFLGSWSSNMNILLAIPTSILGTFIVMKACNFTMNIFTLLGLSLAIGIVVDDAIMVLENIVRHREMGEGKVDAALKGSKEITFAALAATLAIAAIFMPVVYMQGIIGKFFLQFGITITAAVFLSLLEALTLAPMRCSQLLEIEERKTRFGKAFEHGMIKLKELYGKSLVLTLKHKWKILLLSFIFCVVSYMITAPLLRKEFTPPQDQSMFLAGLETPIGSSVYFTSEKFKEVEAFAMAHPCVKRYFCIIGVRMGGIEGEVNAGMLFVTLKQPQERPYDPALKRRPTQQDVMDQFREGLNKIPSIRATMQDLSTRGFSATRGYPVEFSIRGPNWDKLIEYAQTIQDKMKKSPYFQDIDSDYRSGLTEVRITPDRDKAFDHAASVETIARTVNAMIGGERVAKYTQDGRRYDVRVKANDQDRNDAEDIKELWIWNNRGEMVRLGDVVKVTERPSLLSITRQGRERAISLYAGTASGQSLATAIQQAKKIADETLPAPYRVVFSGTSQTFKESMRSLIFALVLGIVVAYMILASQFNHIVHPITVLLALPFSVIGAFWALLIANQSLNIFSFIALLLLMGIVKKNSILLVDFTNKMRERGMNTYDAILTACPIRLRPIIMTSIATIAAAIPPALALGPGAETRIPMGVAIIGGVLVSTLLTLFVVPAFYLVCDKLEQKGSMSVIFGELKNKIFLRFGKKST
ncbi:MAG TPA: efflux RND transporter permease subunit [Candidatus Omnitrophota bacterium]|nr:efflux RND transporter permease subunit [Candidatus Omnitrophota bacterium]